MVLTRAVQVELPGFPDNGVTRDLSGVWYREVAHSSAVYVITPRVIVVLVRHLKKRAVKIHRIRLSTVHCTFYNRL